MGADLRIKQFSFQCPIRTIVTEIVLLGRLCFLFADCQVSTVRMKTSLGLLRLMPNDEVLPLQA